MMKVRHFALAFGLALGVLSFALGAVVAPTAGAQEVLPRPEPPFKGYIGRKAKESVKDFPQEVVAPKGAPNVLLILTDDVGFGASFTFGGPVPTATMDRLAKSGLRYNNFHTTPPAMIKGPPGPNNTTAVIMVTGRTWA